MMRLPNDINLPFFAYGIFKPGQLSFFRIRNLVKNACVAEVNGILKERDGIPLLVPSEYSKFKGVLIFFEDGKGEDAYNRIINIEPDEVYSWGEVDVENKANANALLGKRSDRGSSDLEHFEEWDGKTDPFFKDALDEIEAILEENSQFQGNYRKLFRLQMAYILLWSAMERYASLRYHLGKKVNDKVFQIAKEQTFASSLKKHVEGSRTVYSAVDLEKYTLDPGDPDRSIKYYYQVRSNAVHRGKAVTRDFDTVRSSLGELLLIFRDLLDEAFKE